MEKRSENNTSRRRRNNRPQGGGNQNRSGSRNRSRNRNRNRNRSGGGGSNRNSNRSSGNNSNRNRSRSRRAPKQTKGQKILSILTFGLLGKPKPKSRSKKTQEPRQTARQKAQAQEANSPKPKKKRQRTEVTSGRLYVGNLSYDTSENELEELFRGIGNVISAEVVTNSRTQQSKGFAFVEMGSIDEAKRAVDILDDEDFMGRKLIVSGARSEGPRDSEDEESSENSAEPAEASAETSQA